MERNYECLLMLDQALSDEAVDREIDGIRGLLPEKAAPVFRKWGLRDLSYPVAKKTKGYYLLCRLPLDGELKKKLEGRLKLNPVVLRYIILRIDGPLEAEAADRTAADVPAAAPAAAAPAAAPAADAPAAGEAAPGEAAA